jgi:outer membrane protein assembly factor BamA
MARRWAAAGILVLACIAVTPAGLAQGPPPDPTKGERSDGRPGSDSDWKDPRQLALDLPRLLLSPFRLIFRALSYPTRALTVVYEKYQIGDRAYEATTTHDGQRGVRPEVLWDARFIFAAGLSYFDTKSLGPDTLLKVRFLFGGPNIIETSIGLKPTPAKWRTQVSLDLGYVRRNDQYFNGIEEPNRSSRYAVDAVDLGLAVRFKLARPLTLRIGTDAALKRFGEGIMIGSDPPIGDVYCVRPLGHCLFGTVDERKVPGFDRGIQFVRGTLELALDTRDRHVAHATGFLANVAADYTHGLAFDESSYFRLTGSLSAAIGLFRHSHALVLRASAAVVEPTNRVPVPFTELFTLGGADTLRGFRNGAFRNESLLMFSAEYRWPIWMWADASLFADYGGTFERNFADLGLSGMFWDVGVGLRLLTRSRFLFRVEVAYGFGGGGWQLVMAGGSTP